MADCSKGKEAHRQASLLLKARTRKTRGEFFLFRHKHYKRSESFIVTFFMSYPCKGKINKLHLQICIY